MKKILFDLAFGLMHSMSISIRRLGSMFAKGGAPVHGILRALFPFFLWGYGIFVKLRIMYAAQKKEAGRFIHTPIGEYTLWSTAYICIGSIVLFASLAQSAQDEDAIMPSAILARFVLPEEEISITFPEHAQDDMAQNQEFAAEADAVRPSQDSLTQETASPSPGPFPSEIALNPDALLKPIIPTGETLSVSSESRVVQSYIVKQGDTIGAIASRFGLKANTLLWTNNLSEYSIIHEGQRLTIPPVDGIVYTVRSGDTLGKIARVFDIDIEKIIQINRLASADSISIGQTLILPDARATTPTQPSQNRTLLARLRNLIIPKQKGRAALSTLARFVWPTSARRITQYFNWRHGGIDIAGPTSNHIYAAASGRVILSGWQRGYGLTILVDHGNGYVTRYAHARKLLVSSGVSVQKGDTIAMVGSTGRSTGPHLHFEIHRNGYKQNPLSFIR